ncbi:ATP-binding protein [Marinobacterium weihaiense]|uniref:CHASE domain-containing protein n=1 Tax=Marinobacterium weihaiense TaxID=2851016 RepID=A0ABS6MCG1_9GAMM|nr:ATP-binding protein [Marinobacterium weihaiense]MBV0933963.1 CHASE domain-containing protein [Marinobacterium weihaiense]
MRRASTLLILPLWLLLTLVCATVLVRYDLDHLQQRQHERLGALALQLKEHLTLSQRLLEQVVQLLDVPEPQLFDPALAAALEQRRQLTPGVKRIQLQQRVRSDDIQGFEQRMRRYYPDFLLHGLSAMTLPAREDSGTPIYHPLILVVPDTPSAQPPLPGTDLGLIPALQPALLRTPSSHDITYSRLYSQNQGQPLLNLFLSAPHDRRLIASLVLDVNRWLHTPTLPAGCRLSLSLPGSHTPIQLVGQQEGSALLQIQQQRDIQIGNLPVQLTLTNTLYWTDLLGWVLLPLLISTAISLLAHAWIRQRHAANQYRAETRETERLRQNLQQHSGQLQLQLQENQRLTQRILDIQERERRHLAQELHDELGQCLTAIRTDARMLLQDHPDSNDSVHRHAASIDHIAGHIYDVTYDLMHALRPTLLDDLGLVDAIRELVRGLHLERRGIDLELQLGGALNEMEERYNINLYRMIQEGLTNLQRHAGCTQAKLHLYRRDADGPTDQLEMLISDNGCGFDPSIISRKGRFGVLGLQTRAKALGGSLALDSAPGQGTCLQIRIPLAATADTGAATPSAAESAVPRLSDAARRPA